MARFNLYVDTYSGELVGGPNNLETAYLPKLVQGDTITLRIYLLERPNTFPAPVSDSVDIYQTVNNANLSFRVAIGPKTGTAGSTVYTANPPSGAAWTRDSGNNYVEGTLPLNTAAIASLIGASESGAAWFEIEIQDGDGNYTTVFQKAVSIEAEVIESVVVASPAGETSATVGFVTGNFLKNDNTGFVITDPNTGNKCQVWYDGTNKVMHFDPIT